MINQKSRDEAKANCSLCPFSRKQRRKNTVTIIRGLGQKRKVDKLPYKKEVNLLNALFSSHSRYSPSKNKSANISKEYFTVSELYQIVLK